MKTKLLELIETNQRRIEKENETLAKEEEKKNAQLNPNQPDEHGLMDGELPSDAGQEAGTVAGMSRRQSRRMSMESSFGDNKSQFSVGSRGSRHSKFSKFSKTSKVSKLQQREELLRQKQLLLQEREK